MSYHVFIRILHWLMALMIFTLIGVGMYMTGLEREDPSRMDIYGLHKSFGALVLLLVTLRLMMRLRSVVPPLPEQIPALERKLAKLGHWLLYGLMFAVPVVGICMSNAWGYPVSMFGIELPFLISENKDIAPLLGEAHEILAFTLLGVVGAHALAVVKHIVRDKVNLLPRMGFSKHDQ